MKTKLLFITVLFTVSSLFTNAQCNTSATNFGNNSAIPMYNINGDVDVILNTDNTVTLNLGSNFSTAEGPDIRAYFVASNGISDNALINSTIANLENFEFGLVGAIGSVNQNGAKTFTVAIPDGANISDYDRVFFYCLQFNQFWDFGSITAFTSENCSVLSINDSELSNAVDFYPNPVISNFTIENTKQLELEVSIFNILGKTVFQIENNGLTNQLIDISSLNSGVYLMRLTTDGKTITKRLVKQ